MAATPASVVDIFTTDPHAAHGVVRPRRAWLQFASQTEPGARCAAFLFRGVACSSSQLDGGGFVVFHCYWADTAEAEHWTALPQQARERLLVHHSGLALLLPAHLASLPAAAGAAGGVTAAADRARRIRERATAVWWREGDELGHSDAVARLWGVVAAAQRAEDADGEPGAADGGRAGPPAQPTTGARHAAADRGRNARRAAAQRERRRLAREATTARLDRKRRRRSAQRGAAAAAGGADGGGCEGSDRSSSGDDDGVGRLSLRRSDGGSCGSDCSDGDDGVRRLSLRHSQRRRFPRKRT